MTNRRGMRIILNILLGAATVALVWAAWPERWAPHADGQSRSITDVRGDDQSSPDASPTLATSSGVLVQPSGAEEGRPRQEAGGAPRIEAPRLPPPSANWVGGEVVDKEGDAVTGVRVCVLAPTNPVGGGHPEIEVDGLVGAALYTDEAGRFGVDIDHEGEVFVTVWPRHSKPHRSVTDASQLWVTAPRADLRLVVRQVETTELQIRLIDTFSQKHIDRFRLVLEGIPVGFMSSNVTGTFVSPPLVIDEPGGEEVVIRATAGNVEVTDTILLTSGDDRTVTLGVGLVQDETAGYVVDQSGAPVPGATVLLGNIEQLQGRSPFEQARLGATVRATTDEHGWFLVMGTGRWVSATCPGYSPAITERGGVLTLVLGATGSIRVIPRQGSDSPPSLLSDRAVSPLLENGQHVFPNVAAGFSCVRTSGGSRFGVRVREGQEAVLDARDAIETVSVVLRNSQGEVRSCYGPCILTGTTGVFSVTSGRIVDGRVAFTDVLPGTYILLLATGQTVPLELSGLDETVNVELGAGQLLISGKPDQEVVILSDVDDCAYLRGIASRLRLSVPSSGQLYISDLCPGRYSIYPASSDVGRSVEVWAGGMSESSLD